MTVLKGSSSRKALNVSSIRRNPGHSVSNETFITLFCVVKVFFFCGTLEKRRKQMILMIVLLVVGIFLLVKGADLFVDGACDLSEKLKIPAYLVGLTVVAFGTSLPEAAVSITAAIDGSNEIAIGNVIGSNIFNTLMVLGAGALMAPIIVKKDLIKRDFPFCLGITVLLTIFLITFNSSSAELTRVEGVILLVFFVIFMTYSIILGKKEGLEERAEAEAKKEFPMWKCILFIVMGIAGVAAGGTLTVEGAKMMAGALGMSETVIGLTIVAIGTSLPELVTSVVAAKKKQNDIAVGNVIGSNIFNILFILGISSLINPIVPEDAFIMSDALILTAIMVLIFLISLAAKKINRFSGAIMIFIYAAYTAFLLIR